MRFQQIHKIVTLVPGEKIVATRYLHADEDYLRDHFPLFPVMPGVLMLEALYQSACWLIRATDNFQCSILLLKEAKNVKFADFVEPGQTLELTVELVKNDDRTALVKGVGMKGELTAVSARLLIEKQSLTERGPEFADLDRFLKNHPKEMFEALQS